MTQRTMNKFNAQKKIDKKEEEKNFDGDDGKFRDKIYKIKF